MTKRYRIEMEAEDSGGDTKRFTEIVEFEVSPEPEYRRGDGDFLGLLSGPPTSRSCIRETEREAKGVAQALASGWKNPRALSSISL